MIMKTASYLLFVIFISTLPASSNAQAQSPLVVNYAAINANMLNLWVGKEAKYFAEEGLDVRILHVRGGSLGVQLLVSGQTPIGLVGATAIVNAYLQGSKDLVMIGGVTNLMAYVLASKPEIQTAAQIKGRTLAVSRFGSTADFVAEYALRQMGLQKSDVTMIQIGTEGDRLAAMQRGDIQLSVFTPTFVPALKKTGMRVLLDLEERKVPYLLAGYATSRSYLARERAIAVKFMRGIIKSIKRIKTDRLFSEKVLSQYVKSDDQELLRLALEQQVRILPDLPYAPEEGMKTILEDLARTLPDARRLQPAALIDATVVRDAAKGF
jgi:NitT/TauT family transport system substrate-binding protein